MRPPSRTRSSRRRAIEPESAASPSATPRRNERDALGRLALQQVAGRARADRLEQVLLRAGRGEHDDLALRRRLANVRQRREPVHSGHRQVEQDELGAEPAGLDDRLLAVGRLSDDVEAVLLEQRRKRLAGEGVVVRDQDALPYSASSAAASCRIEGCENSSVGEVSLVADRRARARPRARSRHRSARADGPARRLRRCRTRGSRSTRPSRSSPRSSRSSRRSAFSSRAAAWISCSPAGFLAIGARNVRVRRRAGALGRRRSAGRGLGGDRRRACSGRRSSRWHRSSRGGPPAVGARSRRHRRARRRLARRNLARRTLSPARPRRSGGRSADRRP